MMRRCSPTLTQESQGSISWKAVTFPTTLSPKLLLHSPRFEFLQVRLVSVRGLPTRIGSTIYVPGTLHPCQRLGPESSDPPLAGRCVCHRRWRGTPPPCPA